MTAATAFSARCRRWTLITSIVGTVFIILMSLLIVRLATRDDSQHICRVTAVDMLVADKASGKLQGGEPLYECEFVVTTSDGIMVNNNDEAYFNVVFSPETVQENALALARDEWFVQYHPSWIENNGRTLQFPSNKAIQTVEPSNLSGRRQLIEAGDDGNSNNSNLRSTMSITDTTLLQRRLVPKEAVGKVIIVRITMADRNVMFDANELVDFVYGSQNSLAAQYNACSQGAVRLSPYDPSEPVVELRVEYGLDDYTFDDIFREANPLVKLKYGNVPLGEIAEHVMYVIPAGLGAAAGSNINNNDSIETVEAVSVASLNHFKGMFTDKWFSQIGVLLHQTGHNKGLGHAWEGDDELGDGTGPMGVGEPGVEKVCFNGLHSNHLGWMSERTMRVDALSANQRVDLISYVDYDDAVEGQAAILIVGPYFLTYNLKKGFNSETMEHADQVLIVQREGRGMDSVATNLVGSLDGNETLYFVREDFFSTGQNLVIEVCNVKKETSEGPDRITLGIGTDPTPCNAAPSMAPSVSSAPSAAPTAPRDSSQMVPIYDKESTHFTLNDPLACEDSLDVKFYMNSTLGRQRCSWLRQHLLELHRDGVTVKDAFCTESQDAFHFCKETCGKCTDDCYDDSDAVFNVAGTESTCEWLSSRPFLWTLACKHEEVSLACRESCESC